jgi:hypothetical protein
MRHLCVASMIDPKATLPEFCAYFLAQVERHIATWLHLDAQHA